MCQTVKAIGVGWDSRHHSLVRGNALVVGNAEAAAFQTKALVASAAPRSPARLVAAVAPEREHVAIFSSDDSAGRIKTPLPFFRFRIHFDGAAHGMILFDCALRNSSPFSRCGFASELVHATVRKPFPKPLSNKVEGGEAPKGA
jgi:hypothetical protein